MRRPWNGAMPVTLTLPLGLERRPRARKKRLRRLAVALLALGVALFAAGVWLPARAALAQRVLGRAWQPTEVENPTARALRGRDVQLRRLTELEIGDELTLARPDGAVHRYEVLTRDVVDSERAELALDADEDIVVLVTRWPFDGEPVAGSWRYVVTARQRF
jgi:hypothetical protein